MLEGSEGDDMEGEPRRGGSCPSLDFTACVLLKRWAAAAAAGPEPPHDGAEARFSPIGHESICKVSQGTKMSHQCLPLPSRSYWHRVTESRQDNHHLSAIVMSAVQRRHSSQQRSQKMDINGRYQKPSTLLRPGLQLHTSGSLAWNQSSS